MKIKKQMDFNFIYVLLGISGYVLILFNIFTTKEAIDSPFCTATEKNIIIAVLWLLPILGLIYAYKKLLLKPSFNPQDNQAIAHGNGDNGSEGSSD